MTVLKKIQQDVIFYLLALTVFVFPLSNSLKSIFLTITALAILANPLTRQRLKDILKEPWARAALLLFAVVLLGCIWGAADFNDKINFVNKYSKVLYLPLLAVAFMEERSRKAAMRAFLLAMLATVFVSFMNKAGFTIIDKTNKAEAVFQNRIDTGLFIAFAAYMSAFLAVKRPGLVRKLLYGLGALLFSFYEIFVNTGRTGYVVFAILFVVFLYQVFSLKRLLVYLPLSSIVLVGLVSQSTMFQANLQYSYLCIQQFYQGEKNTSLGFRLQFSDYAQKLFTEKPVLGHGTAGFSNQFKMENPMPSWGPTLPDPHNQYWAFAVDYGLAGLAILLYFFFTQFWAIRNLRGTGMIAMGLLLSFLAASLFDSFLLLSNGGYFFVLFMALGLGESLQVASERAFIKESLPLETQPC